MLCVNLSSDLPGRRAFVGFLSPVVSPPANILAHFQCAGINAGRASLTGAGLLKKPLDLTLQSCDTPTRVPRNRNMTFVVLALDYDGTIASDWIPDPEVRSAIEKT
jgi:hypothetical protein